MDATLPLDFWTRLLQLDGFRVAHLSEDKLASRLRFTLVPQQELGLCLHCQRACETVKQRRTRDAICDLPLGTHSVVLKVRVSQYECEHCGHCFTPRIGFLAEGTHATERFLERAAQLIRTGDVSNAAKFFGVPERTLDEWYCDWIQRQQSKPAATPLQPIRRIGLDELSLKKSTDSSSQ
jgi:transposase